MVICDPSLPTEATHSSLDVLGKVYVEKRLDVEGLISQVIGIDDVFSEVLGEPDNGAPPVRGSHDKDIDAEAIHYHYDPSNDFHQLWLDPEVVYSYAYLGTGKGDLVTTRLVKLRHLCRRLRLQSGKKLFDVGCGQGGLARLAARELGVEVTGITLSREQLAFRRKRAKAEGLEDRVTLKLLDYRDLPRDGRFDKVVSVGMFGHVGHANSGPYFRQLYDTVRSDGLVMSHGITLRYTDSCPVGKGVGDFIDRYVFPHGELPHLSLAVARMSEAGLEVVDVGSLRLHYVRTLDFWGTNLKARLKETVRLVPEETLQIRRLHLAGYTYGFRRGWTNPYQILAIHPHEDGSHELPWSRRDLYT